MLRLCALCVLLGGCLDPPLPLSVDGGSDGSDAGPACIGATGRYRDSVLADNPISYWRLGEMAGMAACDQQHRNDGDYQTGSSSPVLGQPGALFGDPDTSISFGDPSLGQSVAVHDTGSLRPASVTVEGWVKRTSGPSVGLVAAYNAGSTGPNRGWGLSFGGFSASTCLQINGSPQCCGPQLSPANLWFHVAGSFDASSRVVRLYIDGQLTKLCLLADSSISYPDARTVYLGRDSLTSPNYTSNTGLDEVAIYGSALTDEAIARHYQAGRAPYSSEVTVAAVERDALTDLNGNISPSLPVFVGAEPNRMLLAAIAWRGTATIQAARLGVAQDLTPVGNVISVGSGPTQLNVAAYSLGSPATASQANVGDQDLHWQFSSPVKPAMAAATIVSANPFSLGAPSPSISGASGTSAQVTIGNSTSAKPVFGIFATGGDAGAVTPGPMQQPLADTGNLTPQPAADVRIYLSVRPGPGGSTTMGWSWATANPFAAIAVPTGN